LLIVALLFLGVVGPLVLPQRRLDQPPADSPGEASPTGLPETRTVIEQVEYGMTLAEVEKLLGGPAGDYRTVPLSDLDVVSEFRSGPARYDYLPSKRWLRDEGDVTVYFDEEDRVVWMRYAKIHR
jgi:hypothetical protein